MAAAHTYNLGLGGGGGAKEACVGDRAAGKGARGGGCTRGEKGCAMRAWGARTPNIYAEQPQWRARGERVRPRREGAVGRGGLVLARPRLLTLDTLDKEQQHCCVVM